MQRSDLSLALFALTRVMTIAEAFRAELDILEGRALIKPDTAGVRNRLSLSSFFYLAPLLSLICINTRLACLHQFMF